MMPVYNITISGLGVALLNALWVVFTIIAVIMFVVAGIMFLTASGDTEKIKTARSAVIWGSAGVVIGILAYVIINVIGGAL